MRVWMLYKYVITTTVRPFFYGSLTFLIHTHCLAYKISLHEYIIIIFNVRSIFFLWLQNPTDKHLLEYKISSVPPPQTFKCSPLQAGVVDALTKPSLRAWQRGLSAKTSMKSLGPRQHAIIVFALVTQ